MRRNKPFAHTPSILIPNPEASSNSPIPTIRPISPIRPICRALVRRDIGPVRDPDKISSMYSRDKRSPVPKNDTVSRVMSANRAKNSKPEVRLRKALWHAGLKGYRLHHKRIPGRPDISFVGKKLAIFVHGCFWHRCPKCD